MYVKAHNITNIGISMLNMLYNSSEETEPDSYEFWIFLDSLLFIFIVSGNVLTILAIALTRKLRNIVSNYFILNLALSDLLVGITLPYRLAFYMNKTLSQDKLICVSRFVIICLACSGSLYNLIVIAIDRYAAIVHPLSYNSYATRKRVLLIIAIVWICTISWSSIPIYWNCFDATSPCELDTVLPKNYTLIVQMPTFFFVWITMIFLYWKIWREAHMHARRLNHRIIPNITEKSEHKSVQVVLLILGCFSICWLPYFIVVSIRMLGWKTKSTLICYRTTFSLAIANSGVNPIIYAWKNKIFRRAFQKMLHFKSPNHEMNSSLKMYLQKQQQLKNIQTNIGDN